MAAKDDSFDRRRTVLLLQEATRLIAEHVESSENNLRNHSGADNRAQIVSSSSTVVQPHSQATPTITCMLTPVQSPVTPQPSRVNSSAQRALGNFRNLFAPYRDRRGSINSTTQSACSQPKQRKPAQSSTHYKRETWTHTFFCLADCKQYAAPNLALKQQLQLSMVVQVCQYFRMQFFYTFSMVTPMKLVNISARTTLSM